MDYCSQERQEIEVKILNLLDAISFSDWWRTEKMWLDVEEGGLWVLVKDETDILCGDLEECEVTAMEMWRAWQEKLSNDVAF